MQLTLLRQNSPLALAANQVTVLERPDASLSTFAATLAEAELARCELDRSTCCKSMSGSSAIKRVLIVMWMQGQRVPK